MTANTVRELAIELTNVSKSYGNPGDDEPVFHALRDVGLSIPVGTLTTIVGPSGSGKSTLLGLMGLLDEPTSGQLVLAGHSTSIATESELCALRSTYLGFVFQAFYLMPHRTVIDNVMLGGLYRGLSRQERQRQATERLDMVGLGSKVANLAGTLSGGERQRTAIARALVGTPQILLCDEPTGNLDTRNGEAVVGLLTDLSTAGLSVVIVTHDPSIAALGDHQVHVIDGRVSGDGVN